jgi:hypothetical protein
VGGAAFTFAVDETQTMKSYGKFVTPRISRTYKISETKSSVTVDDSSLASGYFEMVDFHAGVAAGLVWGWLLLLLLLLLLL